MASEFFLSSDFLRLLANIWLMFICVNWLGGIIAARREQKWARHCLSPNMKKLLFPIVKVKQFTLHNIICTTASYIIMILIHLSFLISWIVGHSIIYQVVIYIFVYGSPSLMVVNGLCLIVSENQYNRKKKYHFYDFKEK